MGYTDPFTMDLFGNTGLSSGLGLGFGGICLAATPAANDKPDQIPPAKFGAVQHKPAHEAKPRSGLAKNFYLDGDRGLAAGWKERARFNVAMIELATEIARQNRVATGEEQARLIRFTGFGASELANGIFRRPGEPEFGKGWDTLGDALESAVSECDYASLARCTQYAHFTPEFIVRAIWAGLQRLGWRGSRVLEPGIGTGLFPALMPEGLRIPRSSPVLSSIPSQRVSFGYCGPAPGSSRGISRAPSCRPTSTLRSAIRRFRIGPCDPTEPIDRWVSDYMIISSPGRSIC